MVFAVKFFAASGAEGNQKVADPVATNPEPQVWIWPLNPTDDGSAGPRAGFFGQEGHGDSVLLTNWSNTIWVVDKAGDKTAAGFGGDSGMFVPIKYTSDTGVFMSGYMGTGWNWNLADKIPCESGTFFIRFEEPSTLSVQTLNSTFRSVALDANDWVTSTSTGADSTKLQIVALECSRSGDLYGDMDGNTGSTGDVAWSRIDDAAGDGNNNISLADHNWTHTMHDFAVCVSVKPLQTGANYNFGFLAVIDYV